jgi:glycosyltransferase involved in cell wall biosynthesis
MSESNSRVRVLRVIARMNLGGPAHHVTLLSGRLDPDRYQTVLISGRVGLGEEYTDADLDGIDIRYLDQLGPEIRPLRDLRTLIALIRLVRSLRPAIVHTHTAKAGLLGRTAALVATRPRPAIVHTYHGHVLRGYFGRFKTGLFRLLERVLARGSDLLIGVSSATVEELVELRIAPRSKFAVVPLGLELEPFLALDLEPTPAFREELGVGPDDVLFTFTGRLAPIKRPDVMLRAVAAARRDGAPVKLAIVGDGVLRPELEGLAAELGCAEAVRFLGYRRDLTRIASATDAALLTSDNEGTPVALIEAAAAGRPLVSTRVGGVADIVVEGTGLLASPGDASTLAVHMSKLARDPSLRLRMGARAREHVRERFAATRLVADIDRLYSRLPLRAPVG